MSKNLKFFWQSHDSLLINLICENREKNIFCDATIICDGKLFPVHRLVLSSFSSCFKETLKLAACKHPFIIIQDVSVENLETLLNFIYSGEVIVPSNRVPSLIRAAKKLGIWGLSDTNNSETEKFYDQSSDCPIEENSFETQNIKYKPHDGICDDENNSKESRAEANSNVSSSLNGNDAFHIMDGENSDTSLAYRNINELLELSLNVNEEDSGEQSNTVISHTDNPNDNVNDEYISQSYSSEHNDNDDNDLNTVSPNHKNNTDVLGFSNSSHTDVNESALSFQSGENLSPSKGTKKDRTNNEERERSGSITENQNIPLIPVWCIKEETDLDFDYGTHDDNFENEATSLSQPVITSVRSEMYDVNLDTFIDSLSNMQAQNDYSPYYENGSDCENSPSSVSSLSEKNPNSVESPGKTSSRKNSEKKPFKCNHCSYRAKLKQYLIVHLRTHTGEKPFQCTFCSYSSAQKSSLKVHLKTHDEKWRKCQHCTFKTKKEKVLQKHLKVHGYKTWFNCHNCSFKTTSQNILDRHLKLLPGSSNCDTITCPMKPEQENDTIAQMSDKSKDEFLCPRCNLKFGHKQEMMEHVEEIHPQDGKDYECSVCSFKSEVKLHFLNHTCQDESSGDSNSILRCDSCDFVTSMKNRMKNHRKSHAQKEYRCKECPFQADSKYEFSRHKKSHARIQKLISSGQKLYKCDSCSFITSLSGSLNTHYKIYHKDSFYKCNYCTFRGVRKSIVLKHMETNCKKKPPTNKSTPLKPFSCELCSFTSETSSGVLKHKRIHKVDGQMKCEFCSYRTNNKESFDQHSQSHQNGGQRESNEAQILNNV